MAGYAATTRIRRGHVHARGVPSALAPARGDAAGAPEIVELRGSAASSIIPGPTVRERLHDIVVALDQLTWYLRSPDSWR